MKYDLVCFDFWLTLVADLGSGGSLRHRDRVESFVRAVRRSGQIVEPEAVDRAMREEWARYNQVHIDEWRTLGNPERIADLLGRLGCDPLPDPIVASLDDELAASLFVSPPQLLPGMAELLHALATETTLGLISDTSYSPGHTLARWLDEAGVLGLFATTVFSDEVGRAKPDRKVFEQAAAHSKIAGGRVVHVGDREFTDVRGAKSAGWDAVLFLGALPEDRRIVPETTAADHTARTVDELRRILRG